MLGDEPAFLELAFEATLLGLADSRLGFRLRASLRLRPLFFETAALRLRLTTFLLGLALDPSFPRLEGARDVVRKLLSLRSRELGERVPELGGTDRAAVRGRRCEDDPPSSGGGGSRSALLSREERLEPCKEPSERCPDPGEDTGPSRRLVPGCRGEEKRASNVLEKLGRG